MRWNHLTLLTKQSLVEEDFLVASQYAGIATELGFGSTLKTFLGKKKINKLLLDFAYGFLHRNDQDGRKCFVFLLVNNYF